MYSQRQILMLSVRSVRKKRRLRDDEAARYSPSLCQRPAVTSQKHKKNLKKTSNVTSGFYHPLLSDIVFQMLKFLSKSIVLTR